MDIGQMKNIVILKNLPSNIIDEAIVVLKPNKKIKKMQYIKNKEQQGNGQKPGNGYIVKEAEMLVNNYVMEIEKDRKSKRHEEWEKKYNRQKYISFALAFVALVEFIII